MSSIPKRLNPTTFASMNTNQSPEVSISLVNFIFSSMQGDYSPESIKAHLMLAYTCGISKYSLISDFALTLNPKSLIKDMIEPQSNAVPNTVDQLMISQNV